MDGCSAASSVLRSVVETAVWKEYLKVDLMVVVMVESWVAGEVGKRVGIGADSTAALSVCCSAAKSAAMKVVATAGQKVAMLVAS